MSRFSGKQHKGALREFKQKRREDVVARNEMWAKIYAEREKVNAEWNRERFGPTPTERLLMAIYGHDLYMGLGEAVPLDPSDPAWDTDKFGTVDPATGDISYLGGTLVDGVDF